MAEEATETRTKLALRPTLVAEIVQHRSPTLFGVVDIWWVEYDGAICCKDKPIELRHGERVDACDCARYRVAQGHWKPKERR